MKSKIKSYWSIIFSFGLSTFPNREPNGELLELLLKANKRSLGARSPVRFLVADKDRCN